METELGTFWGRTAVSAHISAGGKDESSASEISPSTLEESTALKTCISLWAKYAAIPESYAVEAKGNLWLVGRSIEKKELAARKISTYRYAGLSA